MTMCFQVHDFAAIRPQFMSFESILNRQQSPTTLKDDGQINLPGRSGQRRTQTKQLLMEVHGATK